MAGHGLPVAILDVDVPSVAAVVLVVLSKGSRHNSRNGLSSRGSRRVSRVKDSRRSGRRLARTAVAKVRVGRVSSVTLSGVVAVGRQIGTARSIVESSVDEAGCLGFPSAPRTRRRQPRMASR